jgi:FtsH-binding integral membrane protein
MLQLTPEQNVYLIIGCILLALSLIQILFVVLNSKARKDLKGHTALGVLQIIFGNLISGILIIIRNKSTRTAGFVISIVTCVILFLVAILFIVMSTITIPTN